MTNVFGVSDTGLEEDWVSDTCRQRLQAENAIIVAKATDVRLVTSLHEPLHVSFCLMLELYHNLVVSGSVSFWCQAPFEGKIAGKEPKNSDFFAYWQGAANYFHVFCSMLDFCVLPQPNMPRSRLFPEKVVEI